MEVVHFMRCLGNLAWMSVEIPAQHLQRMDLLFLLLFDRGPPPQHRHRRPHAVINGLSIMGFAIYPWWPRKLKLDHTPVIQ